MLKRFESHYMKMDGHFHINLLKNLHCLLVKTKNKRKRGRECFLKAVLKGEIMTDFKEIFHFADLRI